MYVCTFTYVCMYVSAILPGCLSSHLLVGKGFFNRLTNMLVNILMSLSPSLYSFIYLHIYTYTIFLSMFMCDHLFTYHHYICVFFLFNIFVSVCICFINLLSHFFFVISTPYIGTIYISEYDHV